MSFLPVSQSDVNKLGWDHVDFVYVSGDAYVDHPSFGVAIISRVLEAKGYRVAILPQPDVRKLDDFRQFGKPRLEFLVTAGNIDSMVTHYTAAKKKRSEDAFSPGADSAGRHILTFRSSSEGWRRRSAVSQIMITGTTRSSRRYSLNPARIFSHTEWVNIP